MYVLDYGHRADNGKVPSKWLGRLAFSHELPRHAPYRLRRTIADDARRYERAHGTYLSTCEAPMVRREGPCGKPAGGNAPFVTDWDTGEQHEVSACSRHRDWQRATVRRNQAARPANPPTPCANTGGVLREHFPELDWAELYRWATDGRWVEPPEREPTRTPTLSIIVGDGEESDVRASLTALPGGTYSTAEVGS